MTIYENVKEDRLLMPKQRALLAVIMNEITLDGKPIADKDAIKKLSQMKKGCVKNLALYADRRDMFDKEVDYMRLIDKYLPLGATGEDVKKALRELELGTDIKNMGKIMQHLKGKFDVVDGNIVKQILMGK